jgi:hypothetical protein
VAEVVTEVINSVEGMVVTMVAELVGGELVVGVGMTPIIPGADEGTGISFFFN